LRKFIDQHQKLNDMSDDVSLTSSEQEEGETTAIDTTKKDSAPPSKTISEDQKKGEDGGRRRGGGPYILVILLLVGVGGWLGYLLSVKNTYINDCQNMRDSLEIEMAGLNEMMYDQGLEAGEDIKTNLENMLTMYTKMEESNTDLNDSIAAQKAKIENIMLELEDAKKDKSRYASTVYKLQKETETLRSIMKDYIRTIDSLNVANGILTESYEKQSRELDDVTQAKNQIEKERDDLSDKVNQGSKLVATSFVSEGIKEKGSGSYKEISKASRCTHIRSCFTLGSNSIASSGTKTVYMRVITPDGGALYSDNSNTITLESGASILYSDKKTINYQNAEIDVCIFYKLTKELTKGNYIAEVYCEGVKVGSDSFVLK
jgi:hypothetical protein